MNQVNEFEVIVFEDDRVVSYDSESESESTVSLESEDHEVYDDDDECDIFDEQHTWDLIPTLRFRFRPECWRWTEGELRYDE